LIGQENDTCVGEDKYIRITWKT